MAWADQRWLLTRMWCALLAAAVHVLLAIVLLAGSSRPVIRQESLQQALVIRLEKIPPSPARLPPQENKASQSPARREEGAALPDLPGSQVVLAAKPVVAVPPSIVQIPESLASSSTGTARGAGSGADSNGGARADGSGEGSGRGGAWVPARQVRGSFKNSDIPRFARAAGDIKVSVRFAVGPDGRVATCEVTRSSGLPEVNAMTCRVITARYRFEPARDDQGRPVTEVMEEDEVWTLSR
jgi:periplasmic protein TonB